MLLHSKRPFLRKKRKISTFGFLICLLVAAAAPEKGPCWQAGWDSQLCPKSQGARAGFSPMQEGSGISPTAPALLQRAVRDLGSLLSTYQHISAPDGAG